MQHYIIVISVTAALFLAIILQLAAKPKFAAKITGSFMVIAVVSGICIYGYGYAHSIANPLLAIVRSLYNVSRMFVGATDFSVVSGTPIFQNEWAQLYFHLVHFLALYATASAAIATVGAEALQKLRLWLALRGELTLIYGINAETLDLGKQLIARKQSSVVFVDKAPDAAMVTAIVKAGGAVRSDDNALHPNEGALALAAELTARDPEAICLFPREQAGLVPARSQYRFYPETLEAAAEKKAGSCSLFYMDEDGSNYNRALAALALGHPVYCRTQQVPQHTLPGLTLFNRYACCAQEYWRTHPLSLRENTLVFIGDGAYARHLLEHALLVNIFPGDRRITYHVFGDWADFRRNHTGLDTTIAIDESRPDTDCLHFRTASWNADGALLYRADRIILCQDEDEENLRLLTRLRQYFPLSGTLHVRSRQPIPGERIFGTDDQIYTADAVIGDQLSKTARLMHRIYVDGSGGTADPWEALTPFLHRSNIAAADHLLPKVRYLLRDDSILRLTADNCAAAHAVYLQTREVRKDLYREAEHRRWMRFHSLYNWQYAPVRDNAARLHPLMRDYKDLPESEQAKDDYAWELIGQIGKKLLE